MTTRREINGLLVAWALASLNLALGAAVPTDWPQWRGPARDGLAPGPAWPASLDAHVLQQVWRVEMGPSYSGPVAGGDRVFVTETKDKNTEIVRALRRSDGQEVWQASWEGSLSVPFFAKSNGDWIRSTPAYDGEHLYVAGMRDVLVCLEAATGKEAWRVDFPRELGTPTPDFGFVCSPLVDGEAVFVQAGASFARLNKRTGRIEWRALKDAGGMWGSAFSSPAFAEIAGRRQLLVQTRDRLAGVDPVQGNVLWEQKVPAFRGMNILTPLALGDVVFTSAYGGKTTGFRVTRNGEAFQVTEAWSHKSQGYMSTPVVIDGIAYNHLRSQRLMAIDLRTGAERWTSKQSFGKYWSLVAQGDRILGLDQRGTLYLLKANPEKLEILDSRKLAEAETWAHLALSGDLLFIRELNALAAWRWTGAGAQASLSLGFGPEL